MDQWIVGEKVDGKCFESDAISARARPPLDGKDGAPAALLGPFAVQRSLGSSWTQKTVDRALKELSNGIFDHKVGFIDGRLFSFRRSHVTSDSAIKLVFFERRADGANV